MAFLRPLQHAACWLAPLALAFPWAIVPTHIPIPGAFGYGGFELFRHWLTKYPTFGPVNVEILLGMACIFGLAVLPPLIALAHVRRPPRRAISVGVAVSMAALYIPVLVRLDVALMRVGTASLQNLAFLGGPLLHLAAFVAVELFAFADVRKQPS